jgi:Transposase DDE domain
MKLKERISWLMGTVQQSLFPHLDECLASPLAEREQHLVKILELIQIEKFVPVTASRQWLGRPIKEREAIARAFIAKAVLNFQHTSSLRNALLSTPNLRAICGFARRSDVVSESTFSRAFAEYAKAGLGGMVHDSLVKEHLGNELIGHISRDATAIVGREKPAKKIKKAKVPKKKGRPAKYEVRGPVEPKRLEVQRGQTAEEAIAGLPRICDRGTKKNAKGYKESWNGFKLHLDVNDFGVPISALMTSASVHDSQVAIPLMKLTSSKVTYCYDLMDAAYDAVQIWEQSRELGHVPIIDKNPRGKEVIPMAPHEAVRYNERTTAERCNSRLKEAFGGRSVMVRGAEKVMLHLMFGVLALSADQLLKVAGC